MAFGQTSKRPSARRRLGWLAPAAFCAVAVLVPMAALLVSGAGPTLVGWSGVATGEYETWGWLEWWIPRLAAFRWQAAGPHPLTALWNVLAIPPDLGVGWPLDFVMLGLPLKGAFGPVTGHNLRIAAVLGLNAAAAWALVDEAVRRWQEDRENALIGGRRVAVVSVAALAIAWNPISLWDVADCRVAQGLIAVPLWYAVTLLRLWRNPSARSVAWATAALAACALTWWYYPYFMLPFAILGTFWLARDRRLAALHLPLAVLVVLPVLVTYLHGDMTVPLGTPFPPLQALSVPARGTLGPLSPGLVVANAVSLSNPMKPPAGPPLPLMWIALAGAGVLGTGRSRSLRPWRWILAGCAVLGWTVSLGPYLCSGGEVLPVRLPWVVLYRWLPFWSRLYWPARLLPFVFAALVLLAIPALTALVCAKWTRSRLATAVVCLATLTGVGLAPARAALLPLPVTPLRVPPLYLRGLDSRPGGVIEANFSWNSSLGDYYQSWHGRKLLGNNAQCVPYFGDPPEAARALVSGASAGHWNQAQVARAAALGYRWLVVQRGYGGRPCPEAEQTRARFERVLGRRPDVTDAWLFAWWIPPTR